MRVSIIIPIYNVEPYLKRCLESVMSQNVTGSDVECILVDDCGTDRSMDIAREVTDGYQGPVHFLLLSHERNRGLSAARNTGLHYATGDFVLFIDSDDYLMPGALHYMHEHLSLYPDVDMVVGNVRNKKDDSLLFCHLQEPWLMDDPDIFFGRMLHHQIYLYAWNKLIRRSLMMEYNIRFIEDIIYEDQAWSYELFSHLKSVLLLPEVTYVYEFNPSSIVNTTFTIEKADKTIWSYTISCNRIMDTPPQPDRYKSDMTVDYLLFVTNFLMNGVDLMSRQPITPNVAKGFCAVKRRQMLRALRYGRLLLACFFLLLFWPFSLLQRFSLFRHHYYNIESVVNHVAHLTDSLHKKNNLYI